MIRVVIFLLPHLSLFKSIMHGFNINIQQFAMCENLIAKSYKYIEWLI